MRQRAPHLKAIAEIAGARHDDEFERVAGFGIAEHGIVGGLPAHGDSLKFAVLYQKFGRSSPGPRTFPPAGASRRASGRSNPPRAPSGLLRRLRSCNDGG